MRVEGGLGVDVQVHGLQWHAKNVETRVDGLSGYRCSLWDSSNVRKDGKPTFPEARMPPRSPRVSDKNQDQSAIDNEGALPPSPFRQRVHAGCGGGRRARRQLVNSRRLSSIRETRGNDKIESWDSTICQGSPMQPKGWSIKRLNREKFFSNSGFFLTGERFALSYATRLLPKDFHHKRSYVSIEMLQKAICNFPCQPRSTTETQIILELENSAHIRCSMPNHKSLYDSKTSKEGRSYRT